MIQVAEASCLADAILDVPAQEGVQERDQNRIRHLLYSVADYLTSLDDTDPGSIAYLLNPHLNPWKTVEERLALIGERDAEKRANECPRCGSPGQRPSYQCCGSPA